MRLLQRSPRVKACLTSREIRLQTSASVDDRYEMTSRKTGYGRSVSFIASVGSAEPGPCGAAIKRCRQLRRLVAAEEAEEACGVAVDNFTVCVTECVAVSVGGGFCAGVARDASVEYDACRW